MRATAAVRRVPWVAVKIGCACGFATSSFSFAIFYDEFFRACVERFRCMTILNGTWIGLRTVCVEIGFAADDWAAAGRGDGHGDVVAVHERYCIQDESVWRSAHVYDYRFDGPS